MNRTMEWYNYWSETVKRNVIIQNDDFWADLIFIAYSLINNYRILNAVYDYKPKNTFRVHDIEISVLWIYRMKHLKGKIHSLIQFSMLRVTRKNVPFLCLDLQNQYLSVRVKSFNKWIVVDRCSNYFINIASREFFSMKINAYSFGRVFVQSKTQKLSKILWKTFFLHFGNLPGRWALGFGQN